MALICHPSPKDTTISLEYNDQDWEHPIEYDGSNKIKLRTIWS